MDYYLLLDMVTELGYRLAMSGAETYRVEESINRIMQAYGIKAEAFAIPNCLHVSIETDKGKPMTRMRRIGHHGNDLDAVEKYSNLSRKICAETPQPDIAVTWLEATEQSRRQYPLILNFLGHTLGAAGFAIMFGGSLIDCLCAGICGLSVGLVNNLMEKFKANHFFRIITASFVSAFLAYLAGGLWTCVNPDTVIIGALMILVPGLLFTNALRDIIYGDTNSGINRIVQVLLIAAAIALGTGAAWNLTSRFYPSGYVATPIDHALYSQAIASFVACAGFFFLFNIHGAGGLLCPLGGMLTWLTYLIVKRLTADDIMAYFFSTMFAALYSELMARVRKYPAISYLVISVFPLLPGAGIYYASNYLVRGEMTLFAARSTNTIAIAGAMAVGILLVSTVFRGSSLYSARKNKKS